MKFAEPSHWSKGELHSLQMTSVSNLKHIRLSNSFDSRIFQIAQLKIKHALGFYFLYQYFLLWNGSGIIFLLL